MTNTVVSAGLTSGALGNSPLTMAGNSRKTAMSRAAKRRFLRRKEASDYVKEQYGVPCEDSTLAKYASTGGGPVFRKFGGKAMYTPEDLDRWVEEKLTPPQASTAEVA